MFYLVFSPKDDNQLGRLFKETFLAHSSRTPFKTLMSVYHARL